MARTKNTARAPRPAARSAAHAAPDPGPGTRYQPGPRQRGSGRPRRADRQPRRHHRRHRHRRRDQPPRRPRRPSRAGDRRRRHPHQGRQARHPGHLDPDRPRPLRERARRRPGHDDEHAVTSQPGDDPAGGEQDGSGQQEASGAPASADGDPGPRQAAQPDGEPAEGDPAEGNPAEGSPAGEDTAASHEQDETAPPADGSAPAGTPPDPALVAEIAGHIGQIQAAASAAATVLAGGGDLRAVRAGLDEIYEQAAQARRAAKAAAGGKKAPAARPGGLREKVLAHLRANPGSSFTPHEIHKVNGHSSGAIANALDTLVKHGDAELATEKPRRFRLAGSAAAPAEAQPPAEPGAEDTGAGEETDLAGAA